jgi:hypothetical protein
MPKSVLYMSHISVNTYEVCQLNKKSGSGKTAADH